ncbi:MAG: DUF4214 domain-containing protein [Campylobacter sp.]|uniref:DUF4214 domain-containing protein n=1 Tax=Campylobacter sp. TaxID=205 RepID=UPI002AA773F4|nr:DUF4214 domain-containing protein [Campylobacter sp.]MCI7550220.1 DUF4214 domain-containing protein [Campylobacter sp.]
MALTTTQVNQAFLATLGRPAEGSAATWGSTLSLDALLDGIFIAENTDGDFVEYLYQNILGRASDAEGKAFWNSLLANTSKEEVLAQFKAAVLAAGQADPSNADYQSFIAANKAFVTNLYTNLLGRSDAASADVEGVEFWTNALTSGLSKGELLAQFTAAALSDPNSEDAKTLTAKANVADAITAKFKDFNADVTADQKKAALEQLKATMTEVVAGSTAEDFQERIDIFAGNFQNRVAQVFTTPTNDKPTDSLDASEATAATVFSGNVNLIDSTKGTIQRDDSVAGNSNYADTLKVSVTSDSTNKDFALSNYLPSTVSSIEKLIITAGAANVSGTLNGTNYAESATITSTGDVNLNIAGNQTELKVTAGDKKEAAITVESGSLDNYTGSAAKDTINVKGGSVKVVDTGAGKDSVTIAAAASIKNEGSIKLGAGDDELTIGVDLKADALNRISLDGGEGSKDKLTISTDITAVNSITGFETISAAAGAKISADAANSLTSGTKLTHGSDLDVDMKGKNSLNLKNLGVDKAADNTAGEATVDILNVAKGEITLTSTTNNAIVETITLKATAADATTGTVTIKGIGAAKLNAESNKDATSNGDELKIDGITLSGSPTQVKNYDKLPGLTENKLYYINTAISSADDLSSKSTVLAFMDNNTKLASGKALVALNDNAQNKSYIFEIKEGTGTANAITRNDITLKAIVDNAINKYDVINNNKIEFVDGREERDVKPSGDASADPVIAAGNVVNATAAEVTISMANGAVTNGAPANIDATKDFAVNASGGAVNINDNGTVNTKALVFAMTGTTFAALGAGTKVTADVYVGGKYENGAIVAGNEAVTLTANMVAGDTDGVIHINTTGLVSGGQTVLAKTLDLGRVDADLDMGTFVLGHTYIDINNYVKNVDANDQIKFTANGAAEVIRGSAGQDTIILGKQATSKTVTIDISQGGNDVLDAKAAVVKAANDLSNLATVYGIDAGDKITLSGAAVTVKDPINHTVTSAELKENIKAAISGKDQGVYLVTLKGGAAEINGKYLIYNSANDDSIATADIVLKLDGVVNSISAADETGTIVIA